MIGFFIFVILSVGKWRLVIERHFEYTLVKGERKAPISPTTQKEFFVAELQDLINQHRSDLLAQERRAASQMVRVYAESWRRLRDQVARLQQQAAEAKRDGKTLTVGFIYRLDRMKELQTQVARELRQFTEWAEGNISGLQQRAVQEALDHVQEAVRTSLEAGPHGVVGHVMIGFQTLPTTAVEALVGAASNGGPLRDLLEQAVGGLAQAFTDRLAHGISVGEHPTVIARALRNEFGMGLTRALVISRTETLRAYRSASQQSYQENDDIIDGWIWSAELDETTCVTCWLMHGTEHPVDEVLDGHPNCRCAMMPLTKSWEDLGFAGVEDTPLNVVPGEQAFLAAPEKVQKAVLGEAAYKAWQEGELKLTDFLARSHSERWGTMRFTRSLKAIREGRGGKWNGAEVLGKRSKRAG